MNIDNDGTHSDNHLQKKNPWIGVDLGNARVGVAFCENEDSIVLPLQNICVDSDYFEALDHMCSIVREYKAKNVVVGYPLNMDGSEGKAAKKARRWARQLQKLLDNNNDDDKFKKSDVVVSLQDERLTTVRAHHQLLEAGKNSRKHRSVVDQQSAILILQAYLDREQAKKRQTDIITNIIADDSVDGGA